MSFKTQCKNRKIIKIEKVCWLDRWGHKHPGKEIYHMECFNCKKTFTIFKKRFNQGVGMFCSKECVAIGHSGKGNPKWSETGVKGRIFKTEKRRWFINKRGNKCENCGFNKFYEGLEIHHIKEHKNGGKTTVNNLIVLCSNCHSYVNKKGVLPKV